MLTTLTQPRNHLINTRIVFSRKTSVLVRSCCMDSYNWDHISALGTCTLYLFSPKLLDQGCLHLHQLVQWVPMQMPQMTLHGCKLTCDVQQLLISGPNADFIHMKCIVWYWCLVTADSLFNAIFFQWEWRNFPWLLLVLMEANVALCLFRMMSQF